MTSNESKTDIGGRQLAPFTDPSLPDPSPVLHAFFFAGVEEGEEEGEEEGNV